MNIFTKCIIFVYMNDSLRSYTIDCETSIRRGRNTELIQRRDDKLAARFYYYSQIKRFKYLVIFFYLSQEFDLRERVIMDRLKANQPKLDILFEEKPSINELKKRFPYFSW